MVKQEEQHQNEGSTNNVAAQEQVPVLPVAPSSADTNGATLPPGDDRQDAPRPQQIQMSLPLDWTQLGNTNATSCAPPVIRYPQDVMFPGGGTEDEDASPPSPRPAFEEIELVLVGTAGQKITHMMSPAELDGSVNPTWAHTQLKTLIFRSHVIKTMEGIQFLPQLELLELYDNQIDVLANLADGPDGAPGRTTLRILDMSYNVIREMAPVAQCPYLTELYLANNKLKAMEGLSGLHQLKKLDLGANRIRVMDPEQLSGLINLEELWLGKNKIEVMQGLEPLTKLRRLDIQSNRLTVVENLTSQKDTLIELYLAHNGIANEGASMPTGLALTFSKLDVLDLSRNRLTSAEPLSHLTTLDELWLSGNKIATFADIQSLSRLGESLTTIYLEYNPLQEDPLYRKRIAEIIPSLDQIDATLIGGLAMHGIPTSGAGQGGRAETQEEQVRRLQELVVQRAKAETHGSAPTAE